MIVGVSVCLLALLAAQSTVALNCHQCLGDSCVEPEIVECSNDAIKSFVNNLPLNIPSEYIELIEFKEFECANLTSSGKYIFEVIKLNTS